MNTDFDTVILYESPMDKFHESEIIYHKIEVIELCPYLSNET